MGKSDKEGKKKRKAEEEEDGPAETLNSEEKKLKKKKKKDTDETEEVAEKSVRTAEEDQEAEDRKWQHVCIIATPLASKKLNKKLLKLVKRAVKVKQVCRGVKEVAKALRKGHKGLCVIAGDITPIDVISHLPVLCEEAGIRYCFVPSREDLGLAGGTRRAAACMLVLREPLKAAPANSAKDLEKLQAEYDEALSEIETLTPGVA